MTERREQAHLLDLLGDPAGNGSSGEHVDDVLFWPIEQRQLDGHLAAAQSRAFSRDRDLDEIVLSGSSASVETIADSALFDGQLDGFLIADASSQRFLAANPPICRMLGYTKKELLRMSVPDIHPVEDLKVIQDHFASNLHLRTPATDTLQFLRKDGSVCPGRISTYAIQYRGRLCLIGFIRERSQRNDKWATSEETFKTFISKSAYGFVDFDAKGFVRSTNDRLAAFLGYDDGELRGMHFLQLLDKSVRKRAVGDFKNSAETVLKPPRNYLAMKKNGETCSVETSSIPLFKSGKLVGFQSAVLDVSERIKTETALIKSEGMLRSLIENMPGLVLVVDREARIKYTNRGDENHTPEELVGQTDFDMVHPDYFQACRESLQKAFSTQSVQHLEALGKSGIWWSCQQVPMIENGRAETVMIIC
ncbi:MAG: PAS domain-containing protein, partial [Planctomycetota bacterium]|nr:PAS domain-containing protein [Planctomycetota bacterium]